MLNEEIDMVTTIVVGNSVTRLVNGKMVTARGYDINNQVCFLFFQIQIY